MIRRSGYVPKYQAGNHRDTSSDFPWRGGINTIVRAPPPAASSSTSSRRARWRARRQRPLLAKRANSAGVANHERSSKLPSGFPDPRILHHHPPWSRQRLAVGPAQLNTLPRSAVHPVEQTIRRAHPNLMIRVFIMKRREVRTDDRLCLCLYPLPQNIPKARLSLLQSASPPRLRQQLRSVGIVRDAPTPIKARRRRGARFAVGAHRRAVQMLRSSPRSSDC
jgi:hypothetical protein